MTVISIHDSLMNLVDVILLKNKSKLPLGSWTENTYSLNSPEVRVHIANGGNLGFFPKGGLCIIDADSEGLYTAIPEEWRCTYTVKTGRASGEGKHVYLVCKDAPTSSKYVFGDKGDIRLTGHRSYVLSPGSIHPDSGLAYEVINDAEPHIVSWMDLKAWIESMGGLTDSQPEKTVTTSWKAHALNEGSGLAERLGLKVTSYLMPVGKSTYQKANGEIRGAHPIHSSETGNNFSVDPAANVFYCFRHETGGSGLEAYAISKGLIQCEDCKPGWFKGEVAGRVLDSLEKDGYPTHADLEGIDLDELQSCLKPTTENKEEPLTLNLEADNLIMQYIAVSQLKGGFVEYSTAGAFALMSILADRKLSIQFPEIGSIYTNIWSLLIGDASSGKTSTFDELSRILDFIGNTSPKLAAEYSVQVVGEILSKNAHRVVFNDEIAKLLEESHRSGSHMRGILDLFCVLYDNPNEYVKELTGNREFAAQNVYLTNLFATTGSKFIAESEETDVTGGLWCRFLLFQCNGPANQNPLSSPRRGRDSSENPWNDVIIHARKIQQALDMFDHVSLYPSEEAMAEYNIWDANRTKDQQNELEGSLIKRLRMYVFKLAMLFYMASEGFCEDVKREYKQTPHDGRDLLRLSSMNPGIQRKGICELDIPDRYITEAVRLVDGYFIPRSYETFSRTCREGKTLYASVMQVLEDARGTPISKDDINKRLKNQKSFSSREVMNTLLDGEGDGVIMFTKIPYHHPVKGECTKNGYVLTKFFGRKENVEVKGVVC
jgi:hypothetical protein